MKRYATLILTIVIALSAAAQGTNSKWVKQMFDAKHKMLVEQMQLNSSQQEKFLAIYQAMEREIYQVNRDARSTMDNVAKKKNATDADYMQAAKAMSNAKVKEGQIEAKYFTQLSKVLTKKQLFLLKQAETNFTRAMLQRKKNK